MRSVDGLSHDKRVSKAVASENVGECPFTTLHSLAVGAVVPNKQTRQQLGEQTHDLQELCLYFVGNTLVKTQTPNKNSFQSSKNDLQIDVRPLRV